MFGPLYQLGGASQFSLNSAAFTINVLALLLTVALAIRYGDGALPPYSRPGCCSTCFAFQIWRRVLESALSGPAAGGPARNLRGRFSRAPLALAARGAPRLVGGASAHRTVARGGRLLRSVSRALMAIHQRPDASIDEMARLLILAAVWALPIADQLINSPGNMRRIADFFLMKLDRARGSSSA